MVNRSGANSRRAQTLVTVREMVLRGEFSPGRIIEEVELSKALGASRPIVRATLEKLHQEGLLEEAFPGGAYTPRILSGQDVADAIEARGALESLAAGLAARRGADAAQLDSARRANAALTEATASFSATEPPTADQMARFGELNLIFHRALVALARSPMIELSLDRVQSIAFASPAAVVTPADPGGFAESVREHEAILNAIEAGDAARAEKLVREHARFALRGVRNAIERPARAAKTKAAGKETPVRRSARRPAGNANTGPTSELLLDAAAALFCEKGFNETTTRGIAARLNIHQASLYYHVSGKEELLYRISKVSLEALERRVAAAIRNCGNGRNRLNAFIRGHLEGMFENPDRAFAFISEFRSLSRAHRREMTVLRRNYSDLLDQEIASAVKLGILRRDISVSMLRLALFNYLNWTPRWYHVSGRLPLDDLARIYSRVFFEGVVTAGHGRPALPQSQNPRRRRPGTGHNATLDKFVRTAAELFSKQGYASTSTRALSALIGMEKATLYYHVKSKEDLLYLIAKSSVETLQGDVEKAVEGITCPLDRLAALMRAHCMSLLRDQTQHATVLAEVRSLSPERLAEIAGMRKSYQKSVRRIIEAGQKNGSIRADAEPRYLACMLQGLLDRTVEWYQKSGSLGPAELADSFCEIFLFGAGGQA